MFGPQPENTKAEDRNHQKARSLMDLVVGALCRLGASVSLHMGLFTCLSLCGLVWASSQHTMWWPGPKGEHPVKEGTRQKNNLESHAVILPLHLVHQDNYKVLAQVQGERT